MPAKSARRPPNENEILKKCHKRALTTAKKAILQFSGELARPILKRERPLGMLGDAFREENIAKDRVGKLVLLLAHYGIDPTDRQKWLRLSTSLATELVPGLIVIEQLSTKRGPHNGPRKWKFEQLAALVRDVGEVRTKNKSPKDWDAIYILVRTSPTWGKYKGHEGSLLTRYYEGKELIESRRKYRTLVEMARDARLLGARSALR